MSGRSLADLRYHVEQPDPASEAVLAFIFERLGIVAVPARPPDLWRSPHLVYGRLDLAREGGVVVPVRPGDRFWPALLEGGVVPPTDRLDFDLVAAIGAFLRDEVHADVGPDGLDEHGRLRFAASAPVRAGFGDVPIVDVYVGHLGRILRERFGVVGRPLWPEGRVAAIALSHDVDLPDRYALLGSAIRPWRFRRYPRSYLRATRDQVLERLRDPRPDDLWLFDRVMASEAERGFRSTFFFATQPFHGRRGHGLDVWYDVRASRYRRVIRRVQAAGFEVGLHASYRATEDPTWLAGQRARLADVAGRDITGLRHHYWHLVPDAERALRAHEQAGFRYDSSLAFNDAIGFRRSTASPFRPYDPVLRRSLRTVQLPTFCMDGNLFYTSDDVPGAISAVGHLVDRIVDVGGMGSIDWHVQMSHPDNERCRTWGEGYQGILDSLARRPGLWVTSFEQIERWLAERRRQLRVTMTPRPDGVEPASAEAR